MGESSPDATGAVDPNGASRRIPPTLANELVRAAFVTEESVYGVILVSGMIVVAGGGGGSAVEVFPCRKILRRRVRRSSTSLRPTGACRAKLPEE